MVRKIREVGDYFARRWRVALVVFALVPLALGALSMGRPAILILVAALPALLLLVLDGVSSDKTHDQAIALRTSSREQANQLDELRRQHEHAVEENRLAQTELAKELEQLRGQNRQLTQRADDLAEHTDRLGNDIADLQASDAGSARQLASQVESSERLRRSHHRIDEVLRTVAPERNPETTALSATHVTPLVTVVVPNFNDAAFLEACLISIQRQTYSNFQCIIVDDGSTDESVATARRFAATDDRFLLTRHRENLGLSAARNTGLYLASGPLIAFLDSDDLFLANNLQERVTHFLPYADDSVAGVFSGVTQRSESVRLDTLPAEMKWSPPTPRHFLSTKGECPFNCHAPLLRTDIVRAFGGFRESMQQGAEDWDLWLRMMRNGYQFMPTKHVLAIYRQKTGSMVRAMPADHLDEAGQMLRSSQDPASPDDLVPNSPYWFSEPLSYYETNLAIAQRSLRFIGLAAFADDDQQLERAIKSIDPDLIRLMPRYLNPTKDLVAGVRRGLGLEADDDAEPSDRVDQLATALFERIETQRPHKPSPNEIDTGTSEASAGSPAPLRLLFAPNGSPGTQVMRDLADSLQPDSFEFVTPDDDPGPTANLLVTDQSDDAILNLIEQTSATGGRAVMLDLPGQNQP